VSPFEGLRKDFIDYPIEVSIESLALCNAACTFCPYPTLDRKGTRMSDEVLNRLIDEIISWKRPMYFSPFKVNEPLLDKRTIPICERLNREAPQIVLRMFTNGAALTPQNIAKVAGLKQVAHLWVSLNSHIPEEYEKLMGLNFERTAKNLDYLHTLEFPHTVVLSTVGYPNEDFRYYCFKRWPKFESLAIKRDSWLGFVDAQKTEVPDTPCSRWFELSVTATGKVALCCMDGPAEFSIGDVSNDTLLSVYNSPHWKERREKLLSRKEVHPCSTCTY
jgi:sulfatase maturation enzyme AslB (radical SAM superfamily)